MGFLVASNQVSGREALAEYADEKNDRTFTPKPRARESESALREKLTPEELCYLEAALEAYLPSSDGQAEAVLLGKLPGNAHITLPQPRRLPWCPPPSCHSPRLRRSIRHQRLRHWRLLKRQRGLRGLAERSARVVERSARPRSEGSQVCAGPR
mgnify:CR=1 FL=1